MSAEEHFAEAERLRQVAYDCVAAGDLDLAVKNQAAALLHMTLAMACS